MRHYRLISIFVVVVVVVVVASAVTRGNKYKCQTKGFITISEKLSLTNNT